MVGYIALFCFAIAGTATALPGKNKVDSFDIKKGNVRRSDLGSGAVNSSKVADGSLTGADIADDSLTGADVDESGLSTGGDLSGPLSNAQVTESGLSTGGNLSGPLSSAQVAESGLSVGGDLSGSVDNAQIGSGSSATPRSRINSCRRWWPPARSVRRPWPRRPHRIRRCSIPIRSSISTRTRMKRLSRRQGPRRHRRAHRHQVHDAVLGRGQRCCELDLQP